MIRLLLAALALSLAAACSPEQNDILVLTERGGQHGPFTDSALEWLRANGEENGYTITEINTAEPICREFLERFDGVIQLDYPPFGWSDEAQTAFREYIEEGKGGWIGFHHATLIGEFREGYPIWEWFRELMGGITYMNYIAGLTDGTMIVEDSGHPVMKGVSPSVLIPDDEFYIYDKSPRGRVRVLASVDEDSYTADTDIRMGDHPVVWTNETVKGKNLYIQMGHSPKLIENPDFTRMLENAIMWILSPQPYITESTFLGQQIRQSGILRSPLPVCSGDSYEEASLAMKVLHEEKICCDREDWSFRGIGNLDFEEDGDGGISVFMEHPVRTGTRAAGPPDDPDYATYGEARVICDMHGRDLSGYDRIVLDIYPDCEGTYVTGLNLTVDGNASHLMNLKNHEWNRCVLPLDELECSSVGNISLHTTIKGGGRPDAVKAGFIIRDIRLQNLEKQESQAGWTPSEDRIIISYSGYMPEGRKTALLNADADYGPRFSVETIDGKVRYRGRVRETESSVGRFGIMDFSGLKEPGEYIIRTGCLASRPFRISDKVWEDSRWRVLNYIFCQRCGYAVPGIHDECHKDLFAVHDGKKISYGGGWHDAGDLSQQTLQTGDVTYSLIEAYLNARDDNPLLAGRLMEEARWGLDFILNSRFGDGWRASSMGLLHWTDGVVGTPDDITTVRKHDLAFDNFLLSGYEAFAAMNIPDDPEMKELLTRAAEEDFGFAMDKFRKEGFDRFLFMYEHSYNTSESQYMATVSWAASQLYSLTGRKEYAEAAAEHIRYTLDCQRMEALPGGLRGWFYRNRERTSIVHYIHQSREQVYMQAMEMLCRTQPEHPDRHLWEESIRLYGEYIRNLARYCEPYGMIPGGVYHIDEWKDSEAFASLHIFAPEDAEERYVAQVTKGVKIDSSHYVKRFPVWFNIFNGNTAIHLSAGKAAAICGKYLADEELLQIALEQLYWTVGKNPFGQSLIYGEGYDYPSMSSFSSGEITGEIPVGIRSYGDEDIPFWPAVNNACYKEVWTTSAGKWLSLTAEF